MWVLNAYINKLCMESIKNNIQPCFCLFHLWNGQLPRNMISENQMYCLVVLKVLAGFVGFVFCRRVCVPYLGAKVHWKSTCFALRSIFSISSWSSQLAGDVKAINLRTWIAGSIQNRQYWSSWLYDLAQYKAASYVRMLNPIVYHASLTQKSPH